MAFVKTFNTKLGPKAIGPYSTARIYNGTIYFSGQIGIDPNSGELVSDDVEKQATRALLNLQTIVEEAQCSLGLVLKCTVFLTVPPATPRTWTTSPLSTPSTLSSSRPTLPPAQPSPSSNSPKAPRSKSKPSRLTPTPASDHPKTIPLVDLSP
jgi:enamine deaminase RidA (YjgF/YER057c/UK114 family)